MKTLNPHITFDGNCREAMEFYHKCLGGELRFQTIGESPLSGAMLVKMKNLILHAVLINEDFVLMGSDLVDDNGLVKGNAIVIVLNCTDEREIRTCYRQLSEGGRQTHPLADSSRGTLLGGLTDKYGNHWLLNYSNNRKTKTNHYERVNL